MDGNFECSMREYAPTQKDDLTDYNVNNKYNVEDNFVVHNQEQNETLIKCNMCEFEGTSTDIMIEHIMLNIMSHISSNWTNNCRIYISFEYPICQL